MSRSWVLARDLTDLAGAGALRQHAEDRDALLERLVESFRDDAAVQAAWLWGSFGRGDADDLSDIDIWLAVSDQHMVGFADRAIAGEPLASAMDGADEAPQNAPRDGGFISGRLPGRQGLLFVDLYWQSGSSCGPSPNVAEQYGQPEARSDFSLLFDRRPDSSASPPARANVAQKGNKSGHDPIFGALRFGYLMFSIAAKWLARVPQSDMLLALYPKPGLDEAFATLDADRSISPFDWSIPDTPLEKVAWLRQLAEKTNALRIPAEERGIILSDQSDPCLKSYLAMVEGIVRCRAGGS